MSTDNQHHSEQDRTTSRTTTPCTTTPHAGPGAQSRVHMLSAQRLKAQFPGADIEFADGATLFPVAVEVRGERQEYRRRDQSPSRRYEF